MELNEGKQQTLLQLADMFIEVSNEQLQSICEQNKWNVEQCIDQLINCSEVSKNATGGGAAATSSEDSKKNTLKCQIPHGAVPKINNNTSPQLQKSNFTHSTKSRQIINNSSNDTYSSEKQRVIEEITAGFRVMVILRGAPGSGKSHLAHELVKRTISLNEKYSLEDYVFSTDDYFYDSMGRYKYCVERLEEAHAFNHRRVRDKAISGWSPIIVDNTNMMLWEMVPYAKAAVQNGYLVELLEPNTPWRYSAAKLTMKNKHRVPREKIKIMLEKYEKGGVNDIIKLLKSTKYTVPLPQMRTHPPIQQNVEPEETFQVFKNNPSSTEKPTMPKAVLLHKIDNENVEVSSFKLLDQTLPKAWTPHEEESITFWEGRKTNGTQTTVTSELNTSALEQRNRGRNERTLLELLKEGVIDANTSLPTKSPGDEMSVASQQTTFHRHNVNCRNENKSFASLRQIYPNKLVTGLWDLFVKCNGDIDWAVDILLKEDELAFGVDVYKSNVFNDTEDEFRCCCDAKGDTIVDFSHSVTSILPQLSTTTIPPPIGVKPQRHRGRGYRSNQQRSNAEAHDTMRETIENCFVLGDEHYSKHVRKVRDVRNGCLGNLVVAPKISVDIQTQTEFEDEQEYGPNEDIIEVALGEQLVQQLNAIFKADTSLLGEHLPPQPSLNVFMPRTLAKELYMLWMESAYNQMEEQRQQTLREDESFARLLKNPKYEHCKQSPSNIDEVLDMEMAWMIYNSEREHKTPSEQYQKLNETSNAFAHPAQPTDLAAHLTLMKLVEIFPDISPETLLDILATTGNRFSETVKVLYSMCRRGDDDRQPNKAEMTQDQLLERAMRENELLTKQTDMRHQKSAGGSYSASHSSDSSGGERNSKASSVQPDEAKRLALRNFEEMRNLAAHHCQLKAECYQKAKEAIQKGNSGVAVYYSQIANLHKRKIDMFNHRAANCIIDVHNYTQNNPDLLDLHYLYVLEAACCLDLFLDRHITILRSTARSYKHVFIITGRGLHSVGGVSTIKNKVRSRLKERNLRWSEVNPGLLKVKIFSASRHSKNI